jgi:uncharacterized protein (TIGR02147 family)
MGHVFAADCLQKDSHRGKASGSLPSMGTNQTYYILKLKENLSLKQRSNPHYSLRAYARDLGLHSSTLSQVLKGKRSLPVKNSLEVVTKLNLGPKERTLFLESIYQNKSRLDDIKVDEVDDRFMLDESYYKAIAEWEHFAFLDLIELEDFKSDLNYIAAKLGITINRAEVVINNLLQLGLMKIEEDEFVRIYENIRTTEDIKSQALKAAHLETLDLGKEKLEKVDVTLRDFSSMTLAIDPEKMNEAKAIISEFHQKFEALFKDGEKSEVYQLAIQFYPLTKKSNQGELQ